MGISSSRSKLKKNQIGIFGIILFCTILTIFPQITKAAYCPPGDGYIDQFGHPIPTCAPGPGTPTSNPLPTVTPVLSTFPKPTSGIGCGVNAACPPGYFCRMLNQTTDTGTCFPNTSPTPVICTPAVNCSAVEAPQGCTYVGRNSCTCGTLVCTNPSLTPSSSCQYHSRGDANCDGKINTDDFNIWRDEFLFVSPTNGPITPQPLLANFSGSGVVTTDDFNIWRDGFLNASLPH